MMWMILFAFFLSFPLIVSWNVVPVPLVFIKRSSVLMNANSGVTSKQVSSSYHGERNKINKLLTALITSTVLLPRAVKGARGAFEMDADFYLRALTGQKPNAVLQKSIYPSPRTLDKSFAQTILTTLFAEASLLTGKSITTLQQSVEGNIPYALKYFKTFLPIKSFSIDDQYYFDIYLYQAYLEIGKLLPRSEDRVAFQKIFGRQLLHVIFTDYLQKKDPLTLTTTVKDGEVAKINSQLDHHLREILNLFQQTNVIESYRLNDEKLQDEEELQSFATEDDYLLNFQLTIQKPVGLIGFLEQSASNSLFHPNLIAYVLRAYLESPGIKAMFDDYLVDNYYKENNFDLQAQDILIDFKLSR